ncbi:DUF3237 domain-containing protein [Mycobacterium sp. CBMA247]|uniref:DUF3237 family protein n=1 Tax=Mycolicibacterium sp. CBMA 295 TaxID=2606605 RepID=UPI0012DE45C6|nr:DUF3237 domain-containing protein [Mycolicibacterium sp. CBMA 329]MUL88987.1 DUF3237 domain-containing protein [Mycolicibacterium sp. CBMA 331]MUL97554.1 DUF3237 domain-containing protein [Mycolicibacterium sp. CBMA 334]MUM27193.1 DUF3237 domain-containing protein [Mycolicibacterium sp. CBMA 295]MUM38503.1 DUF3237 domain-containing protein [Mycolicibacterium sp. CBMA 247]MUM45051.1 DUF3237 domain-containing protein [Mycolicibacterium sp. CBMA 294]
MALADPYVISRHGGQRRCLVFETDDPQLDWLTRAITIGKGHRLKNSARIEVFEVK